MSVQLNGAVLNLRLAKLFDTWEAGHEEEGSVWFHVEAVTLYTGKTDPSANEPKTCAFQLWLLGFEFPDTVIVAFRNRKLIFLTGAKKAAHLNQVKTDNMTIHLSTKEDNSAAPIALLKKELQSLGDKPRVGLVPKETHKGAQADLWAAALKDLDINEAHIGPGIAQLMVVKDENELDIMRKSGLVSDAFLKQLVLKVENIIEKESLKSHSAIDQELRALLDDEKTMQSFKKRYEVDEQDLDLAYTIIQSGGHYDLKVTAQPDGKNLHTGGGVIILGCGAKYKEYCTSVIRTFIVNPKTEVAEMYHAVMAVCKTAMKSLKPKVKFSDVYAALRATMKEKSGKMEDKFSKRLGHCIGLEVMDFTFSISKHCDKLVEEGMAVVVSVGVGDLQTKDKTGYAIWVSDTFLVQGADMPAYTLTHYDRKLDKVTYELEEDAAKENKDSTWKEPKQVSTAVLSNVMIKERLRSQRLPQEAQSTKVDFMLKQRELRRAKQDQVAARFTGDGDDDGRSMEKKTEIKKLESISAYNDSIALPKDLKPNKIHVDSHNNAILVPFNGTHVPFHVSTIKNVSQPPNEGVNSFLRINFFTPGSGGFVKASDPLPILNSPNSLFVKELSLKTTDSKHMAVVLRQLKELIKKVKIQDEQAAQKKDLVEQQSLIFNKTKTRAVLKDMFVRPNVSNKRVTGTLEAHGNGFRFQATGRSAEIIDIIYSNISHAIFQDAQNELIIVLHFHLKNPIMVGKRKLLDVQFYTEAGAQADDLDSRRRRAFQDPDEIAEEQREREMRNRLNKEFKRFCEAAQEVAQNNNRKIEFDIPYKQLGFFGVPTACRANVTIYPCSDCLASVSEWPPFVLSLENIEVVYFERVQHGLRQFDIVFIMKDYSSTKRIDSVPVESLDKIKEWLNECNLVFYEGPTNLNWVNVLKYINNDVANFARDGGWAFLGDEDSEHAEGSPAAHVDDEEEDSDEDFTEADSPEGSDYSDGGGSGSDEESLASEDDDDGSFQSLDSDEEGKDWDELEEEARQDDIKEKKRKIEDQVEDSRPKKNRKK
eukprot:Platyproteum_vivax@DN6234_c0_g1_i2.p1